MEELVIPRLMLVSGAGRNSGKTLFICKVLEKLTPVMPVTAVKLSPHMHGIVPGSEIVFSENNVTIVKERDYGILKDSVKFLRAGARDVFYIQAKDDQMVTAMNHLLKIIPAEKPIIMEGGWFRKVVKPGLFVFCRNNGQEMIKESAIFYQEKADIIIEKNQEELAEKVSFDGKVWKFNNHHPQNQIF